MNSRTLAVTIKCLPTKAFHYITDVAHLLDWAPAFADSISHESGKWIARKEGRSFELKMVSDERSGVADFHIIPASGVLVVAPSRVLANGSDTEYIFTLFQLPNVADGTFAQTVEGMHHEFATLRKLLEQKDR